MSSSAVIFLAFLSGTLVVGAAAYLLAIPIRLIAGSVSSGPRRLRRIPTVFDESPARSLTEKLDQGFNRLVLESGTGLVPVTGFLLTVICASLAGGAMLIYSNDVMIACGSAMLGLLIPLFVLSVRRGRRLNAIREELPHVLDTMGRATRAGQSIEQAIELLGSESGGILGEEFQLCSRQLAMGRSFERVMKSLASRVRLVDIRIFCTTLMVQKQSGGRLSDTLERMSGVVRDRLNAQRQMRASTGAGRASTMVIAAISPIAYAFVFMFHRTHLEVMYTDQFGRILLLVALFLEIIGLCWVAWLLRTESS
ncbi:MAG: type II secretion system F family protein [Planctomycetota bacterium]|nr:type II secretion system F family protein [Planctomycetota bacterium]MDA1252208.1 type II secretion system F family protein [Planctomycetota bacterium]